MCSRSIRFERTYFCFRLPFVNKPHKRRAEAAAKKKAEEDAVTKKAAEEEAAAKRKAEEAAAVARHTSGHLV